MNTNWIRSLNAKQKAVRARIPRLFGKAISVVHTPTSQKPRRASSWLVPDIEDASPYVYVTDNPFFGGLERIPIIRTINATLTRRQRALPQGHSPLAIDEAERFDVTDFNTRVYGHRGNLNFSPRFNQGEHTPHSLYSIAESLFEDEQYVLNSTRDSSDGWMPDTPTPILISPERAKNLTPSRQMPKKADTEVSLSFTPLSSSELPIQSTELDSTTFDGADSGTPPTRISHDNSQVCVKSVGDAVGPVEYSFESTYLTRVDSGGYNVKNIPSTMDEREREKETMLISAYRKRIVAQKLEIDALKSQLNNGHRSSSSVAQFSHLTRTTQRLLTSIARNLTEVVASNIELTPDGTNLLRKEQMENISELVMKIRDEVLQVVNENERIVDGWIEMKELVERLEQELEHLRALSL